MFFCADHKIELCLSCSYEKEHRNCTLLCHNPKVIEKRRNKSRQIVNEYHKRLTELQRLCRQVDKVFSELEDSITDYLRPFKVTIQRKRKELVEDIVTIQKKWNELLAHQKELYRDLKEQEHWVVIEHETEIKRAIREMGKIPRDTRKFITQMNEVIGSALRQINYK